MFKRLKLNFYLRPKKKIGDMYGSFEPKILLCDEIFAALDVLTIQMLKEIIVNLQKKNQKCA